MTPVIKLYTKNSAHIYEGGMSHESIARWATGITGVHANEIVETLKRPNGRVFKEILNNTQGKIDKLFDHIVNERTSLGVRVSTAEKIKELNDEDILNIQDVLSKTQDTDVVEKFIELKSAEMIYQASIQVGAKLIQPTILDYIR